MRTRSRTALSGPSIGTGWDDGLKPTAARTSSSTARGTCPAGGEGQVAPTPPAGWNRRQDQLRLRNHHRTHPSSQGTGAVAGVLAHGCRTLWDRCVAGSGNRRPRVAEHDHTCTRRCTGRSRGQQHPAGSDIANLPDLSTGYHNYWVRTLPTRSPSVSTAMTLGTLTPDSLPLVKPGSTTGP